MGSIQVDDEEILELEDSGYIQDESDHQNSGLNPIGLLDLSDDVLLYVLRYCSPRDLKALGFSCARLGRLVQERSLWRVVNGTSEPWSSARLYWHLQHTLHSDTRTLLLSGFAKVCEGCLGLANITRKEAEDEKAHYNRCGPNDGDLIVYDVQHVRVPVFVERHRGRCFFNGQRSSHLARFRGSPTWPENVKNGRKGPSSDVCCGPQFNITQSLLRELCTRCPNLTTLGLDYCNIDCNVIKLPLFPKTLKSLSLVGTKCFNVTIDKSFLYKIQDCLPSLTCLDVSECEWMEPAVLLPLSKMGALERLFARDCPKLAEFVAYASLTARYGFKALKELDLRGSPVGDSEVASLGWLVKLEKLWLSAVRKKQPPRHLHYTDDEKAEHWMLDEWEIDEPEYFKTKWNTEDGTNIEQIRTPVQASSSGTPSTSRTHDLNDSKNKNEYAPPKKRKRYNEVVIGQRTESIDARDGEKYIHTLEIKVTIDDDGEPREKGGDGNDHKKEKTDKSEEKNKEIDKEESPKKERPMEEASIKVNPDAGASTSKGTGNSSTKDKTEGYVCFRQNRNPIYVNFKKIATENDETETDDELDESNTEEVTDHHDSDDSKPSTSTEADTDTVKGADKNADREADNVHNVGLNNNPSPACPNRPGDAQRQNINYQVEPRHHVLYVNFGPQANTYRFPREDSDHLRFDLRSLHLNPSSLVTDFAMRRFGRADGEDVNIIHLAMNGQVGNEVGYRPNSSNLRFLSVTGYRNITDRSLVHLATSAPLLTEIDFTETSITDSGAENFRSHRPDCVLKYSQYVNREDRNAQKDEDCVTEFFL